MKRSLLFFLLFLLVACNNSKHNVVTIHIDIANGIKKPYGDIAKTSKLIRLNTDSNCMIHEINKIYLSKDRINVLDRDMLCVYTFDRSGKFLYKVNTMGSGVGKYMRIDDFESNEDGSTIQILDGSLNKLITYSGGKFIKERALPFRTDAFASTKDGMLFHRDIAPYIPDLMYQVIATDKNLTINNKFLEIKKTTDLSFAPQNVLQSGKTGVSFLPIYSPFLYNINSEGITKEYFLDFGKNWITDAFIYTKRSSNTFISDLNRSDFVYFLNTVNGDNYLTISFSFSHKLYTAVYNKIKKDLVFVSDFNSSYCGDFGFQSFQEGQFISVIKPQQLLEAYKNGTLKRMDSSMDNIIKSTKNDDNPLIMMTTFQ